MAPQEDLPEDQVAPVQHVDLNVGHRLAHHEARRGRVQVVAHREQAQLGVQTVDHLALGLPEPLAALHEAQQVQVLCVAQTQEVRQEEVHLRAALHKERRL